MDFAPALFRIIQLHADGFGDERGAGSALDFDRVLRGDAHAAAVDRLDRFDLLAQPDAVAAGTCPVKRTRLEP